MRFHRSFISLYSIIISVFILSSWILDEVWSSYLEQDIESYTGYKFMLHAIGDYLAEHPDEEWEVIVKRTSDKYGLPLALIPLEKNKAVDRKEYNSLSQGNTSVFYKDDEVVLHHLVEGSATILTLGPAKMPTRPRIEALVRVGILTLLGLLLYFGLRPLSRDIESLRKTAKRFGDGNFEVRAPDAKSTMVKPMARAFNIMADRIKRLIVAHKEMSSAVAHELRTPLARSKFALEMLAANSNEEKQAKYRNQISTDISELEELVNEMLVYAQFDNDKPDINIHEEVIGDIVQRYVGNQGPFSGTIMIDSTVGDMKVDCDQHFIGRALSNCITNAMKYGDDKIKISIRQEHGYCLISVADNGSGVSDEFKTLIFDAFSRGDNSRNRDTGGFGLGLAIVHRIMEWHHGSVIVEDSDMGGALFTLKWPISHIP